MKTYLEKTGRGGQSMSSNKPVYVRDVQWSVRWCAEYVCVKFWDCIKSNVFI
jgi:hypothetical protein